jgi:Domain of unknown function (DUF222)
VRFALAVDFEHLIEESEVFVSELLSALDALAAEDLDPLSAGEQLDRIRSLVAAQNRLAAVLTRAVRTADRTQAVEHDGQKSTASWLRSHTRLSDAAARRLIDSGRALEQLPAVDQVFAAGAISAEAVTAVAPIATPDRLARAAELGVDVAEIAATLAVLATEVSHRRLREAVGFYTRHLDPDGAEPDPTEGRSLTMSRLLGGAFTGSFLLDAVGGEKVATALESIAAASRCPGDARTAAQVRGDALVQLCDLALASGQLPILRTVKPHVGVLIGIEDLVDPATGVDAGTTGLGAAISAARARWIACDGSVSRILMGPDSVPVDMGRDRRVAPPALRRAVELRDQSCVFAGCEAPAWWCEVHHVLHWGDGGETCLENSALLCERHHGKVHHGFRIDRDPDGRWHTYRPDGTEIVLFAPLRT